jgi:hypothetical protein
VVLGKEIIKVVFNYWLISYQNILGIARGLMKLCRRPEEMICLGQIIKMLPCFPMKEGYFPFTGNGVGDVPECPFIGSNSVPWSLGD